MKKSCIVTILILTCFLLCGYDFAPSQKHIYFTLYYDNQRLSVSEKTLQPKWFNTESHTDFTKGETIYQRAADAQSIEKDFPEIDKIVKKVEREIERKAFDGNIFFDPKASKKFWVANAQNGIEMDVLAARTEILTALKNQTYADIIVKTKEIPHKTEKEVLSKIGLRASYTTSFDAENQSRSGNIERSAECFNGLCLMPGEVLSFNKIVGPRTADRGYEEAKIIIDGEFVPGIGGGVCQTSTTLFNAALLSGLTVEKSQNHSLPISYVPLGRDAMVSSAVDLVLKNNTGGTVYFETGIQNGKKVFVKIYGDKLGDASFKPVTEVTEKPQELEIIGNAPADISQYRKLIIDDGYPARSVRTFLEVYDGEQLVSKKLIRKSNYKGKKEIVKYEPIVLTTMQEIDIVEQ